MSTVTTYTGQTIRFDLAGMDENARAAWLAIYELGYADGWQRGYEAAEADLAALQRQAHAVVQHAARQPSYADLCDRRGEHHRAQRQRELLNERGLAS